MKQHNFKKKMFLWLVCLLFSFSAPLSVAATVDPMSSVEKAVNEIIHILQDQGLSGPQMKEERRRQVVAVVERYFDFREMSMRSLARFWRERTPEEKKQFVDLFKQLLEETYINRVDAYSGEQVVFKRQEIRGNKAVVYTNFIKNNTETPVYYKLKNRSGHWVVYDVIIENVSLVRNYRTQFESIIKKERYAGLLKRMQEKIAKRKVAE